MDSTPIIMEPIDLPYLPVSALYATDARSRVSITEEWSNRFTRSEIIVAVLALMGLVLLQFLPYGAEALSGKPIPLLQNLASLSSMIGASIAVIGLIRAIRSKT